MKFYKFPQTNKQSNDDSILTLDYYLCMIHRLFFLTERAPLEAPILYNSFSCCDYRQKKNISIFYRNIAMHKGCPIEKWTSDITTLSKLPTDFSINFGFTKG